MLAGEISNLAGFWLGVVTRRDLAADVRIKMTQSGGAIAVGWNWPTQIAESANLFEVKSRVSISQVERSSCSQIVHYDSIPKANRQGQLRNVRTGRGYGTLYKHGQPN